MPKGIELLLPFESEEVRRILETFYFRYYADRHPRKLILGINPGRHGAGITGVPFTDSKRLKENCGITTHLKSHEPSSEFVYMMIDAYGGAERFYQDYFISSISPVGFVKDGKNYNYYDDPLLQKKLQPYVIYQMQRLLQLDLDTQRVICLGEGKNYKFLLQLNAQQHWFGTIAALPHPRFVMQYKRSQLSKYIDLYIKALSH